MATNPERRYTLEEYLELDRTSEERWEFWGGEVFCMCGGSRDHDQIITNLIGLLFVKLAGRRCRVFSPDMRVKVPSAPPYRYADVSALCGEAEFEEVGGVDAMTNPALIVEVLSPSTETYDLVDKFTHYQSIATFSEHLLIAQHRPHVTRLVRRGEGEWLHTEANDLDAVLTLESIGCELPLAEIYRGVGFGAGVAE